MLSFIIYKSAGSDIPDKTGSGEEWPNGSTKYSTATPREAHTGAPGAKGAGNKGGKKEGEKEDKSEDGKAGSRASMEGPPPQPQPQQQQQQQQFEYVSVSRLNSTSGSVKLKSKPSSNVDEGEVASGRFGRLSNCSAGKGGNREEPGGAEIESSKPSQQPSASNSPKVKSKVSKVPAVLGFLPQQTHPTNSPKGKTKLRSPCFARRPAK